MGYYYYNNGGGGGGFLSRIPAASRTIIIINIAMLIMTTIKPDVMTPMFALFYPTSQYFHWWQPISHMFMHGGFWHLFFNMYTLMIFGSVLERVWGPKKFLIFYFVTGLGASALHMGVQWIEASHYLNQIAANVPGAVAAYHQILATPTVGASGAIYGLLLGYAMLYPDSVLTLIFPPISLKAKWFVLIFAAIELVTGITGTADGIAHFAHLGGMLFGFLLITLWKKQHKLYDFQQ